GEVCDLDVRVCAYPPCEGDEGCPEGTYCNEESVCSVGCRDDLECGEDEEGRALSCDLESRSCVVLFPCCLAEGGCMISAEASCEASGGSALSRVGSAPSCSPDPCGPTCELDEDCASGDEYCDPIDLRCRPGCREGQCEAGRVCNLSTRICEVERCEQSADCGAGRYCEPATGRCVEGCGDDRDCAEDQGCLAGSCVPRCARDVEGSCAEGEFCDARLLVCRAKCERHLDCFDGEACEPSSQECFASSCRDDEATEAISGEPNDDEESSTLFPLSPIPGEPGKRGGVLFSRVICSGNSDFYQLELSQGERMRISLAHDPAQGDLNFRLHNVVENEGEPIDVEGLESPAQLIYPDAGIVRDQQQYFIEVYGMVEEQADYELRVAVNPLDDACFEDERDLQGEGDDSWESATALVVNGESRYDEGWACNDDPDFYSLPMTVNDGLQVRLSSPLGASDLHLALFPESAFRGLGEPTPRYRFGPEESIEEADARVYSWELPFESGQFSDENWYLRVVSASSDEFAAYQLEVTHRSAMDACVNDMREPNDNTNTGSDPIGLGVPADNNGRITQGADHRINDGVICAGDVDYYCFEVDESDTLEAWVVSDEVIGSLEVRIVDEEGGVVGSSARHSRVGEDFEKALHLGAPAGRYCTVVEGLANAQGPYTLYLRRLPTDPAGCAVDLSEAGVEGRNDLPAQSTSLVDISDGEGLRFEQLNGLLCDQAGPDEDWYALPVNYPNARVCAVLDGFNNARADIDIQLFGPPSLETTPCANTRACLTQNAPGSDIPPGGVCIDGHCQLPLDESVFTFDTEMVNQGKNESIEGAHRLRVFRGCMPSDADYAAGPNPAGCGLGDDAIEPYRIAVTVTPESELCEADWQERDDPNDNGGSRAVGVSNPTILGAGAVALCDTWLCHEDDEDWYQVTVPAGEDRTVFIGFDHRTDGNLSLTYWRQGPEGIGGDLALSVVPRQDFQCMNIRGGELDETLELGVVALSASDDGDTRVDYVFRVVPTDLDLDPRGACPLFGAGQLDPCSEEEGFPFFADNCWPILSLP
ncbi:MAG: hypothetical protein VYD19_06145, partial [Myxococcota bacterium]|nr:hypothetical protein [Myxococcota bacterium]